MAKGSALHRLDCNFGQFRKKYYVSELNRLPLVKVSTDDLKVLRQMLKMGFRDTRASARTFGLAMGGHAQGRTRCTSMTSQCSTEREAK